MKADQRPRDSMKSTWQTWDKKDWGLPHWLIFLTNIRPQDPNKPVPVFQKTDKMAYMRESSTHVWIWAHAGWVIAAQMLIQWYIGHTLHPISAFILYNIGMQINSIHELWILRRMGHKYGFLDGDKHARDGIPDVGVWKVFNSLELTTTIRPMLAVILAYKRSMNVQLSWWLPIELGLYQIVLDGFFYLYHRSCHELDGLWKYHRTHHLTKHPNPTLSSYADSEQEFLELALIPVLSWAVVKYIFGFEFSFHDWWVCHEYIIFSEAFGHSGVRIYSHNPGAFTAILKIFDCDLMIEDHDLHHRKGWRKSQNYGKQTRLWDRIFGTCGPRIESVPSNKDETQIFNMPLI